MDYSSKNNLIYKSNTSFLKYKKGKMMFKKFFVQILWLKSTIITCYNIFKIPAPFNISLDDYHQCLLIFYKSQPVWSWVVMHEKDKNQPFDKMLKAIYSIKVPMYNYDNTDFLQTKSIWFRNLLNISTIGEESKIFFLSKSHFHVNLMGKGAQSFRSGDKILFSNYDKGKRVDFIQIMNFFDFKTSPEGLTKYNLLPIVSFLLVSELGKAEPAAYLPNNRSSIKMSSKTQLTCETLFSNAIDKLIFEKDYFTIAVFETIHAQKHENEYYGQDAFIIKNLVGFTKFPYVYATPSDAYAFKMDDEEYFGAFEAVIKGEAQIALNSRFLWIDVIVENKVEMTYPYRRDDLVILMPVELKTSHLYYFTYYSYGISVAIIILLYVYFKFFEKTKSIIEILLLFVLICSGKSIATIDTKYFRIIYMSMMILAFYGYTLFNIQILSALTLQPSEISVKTVQEFAKTNHRIYSGKTINVIINRALKREIELGPNILPRMHVYSNESKIMDAERDMLMNCTGHAIICTKSTAEHYRTLSRIRGQPFCYNTVPEAIMPTLVTYVMGYRSPFHDKFDKTLSRIIESGLVANFSENSSTKKEKLSEEVKPFGMKTYREKLPWIVFIFGISIAIGVFVLELFVFYCFR